jgi:hypothetical protein
MEILSLTNGSRHVEERIPYACKDCRSFPTRLYSPSIIITRQRSVCGVIELRDNHNCCPLILKNSRYFGAHLLRHALPQIPIGTAAAILNMTMTA